VSDFFLLGQTQTRHNQTLYAPGSFNPINNTAPLYITTLYLRYGQNTASQGNTTVDSLVVSLGQTDSTRLSAQGNFVLFEPEASLTTVFADSSFAIPEGTQGNWIAIPLPRSFEFQPWRSLVLDIKFKSSSNAFFTTLGSIRPNERIRIGTRRFTDTAGGLSEVMPHFGFNALMTASRPSVGGPTFRISPNPSTGLIAINADRGLTGAPYRLTDAMGRIVQTGRLDNNLHIEGLRPGIYLMHAGGVSLRVAVK
jgi:hypothetical protein